MSSVHISASQTLDGSRETETGWSMCAVCAQKYEALEDFDTPQAVHCSLLYDMVKIRRSSVMKPLMDLLIQVSDEYVDATTTTNFAVVKASA